MKILVLAGGFDQIALIEELKQRGHEVYLADYLDSPPAQKHVLKHYQVSTLDEDGIYNLARDNHFDLITTACTDQALLTVARVSQRLGLPCYLPSEVANAVTNKMFMKQIFVQHGIPSARYCILESNQLPDLSNEDLKYPIIVKPCDCNSSKGVVKVENEIALEEAVCNAYSLSRTNKVIIEEFVDGVEISIDVWVDAEGAKVLSVSKTNKLEENVNNFTIFQSVFPVALNATIMGKITEVASKIANAFNLKNCPILIQAIISADNVYVVEFSARMGGGSKYKFIEYMSGLNIMHVYVNRILGDKSQIIHVTPSKEHMELDYVYCYNGQVNIIKGFNELLTQGIISELFMYKSEGCCVEKRTTSSDRILGFLIKADNESELIKKRKYVVDNVDIFNENNQSIMYKQCF